MTGAEPFLLAASTAMSVVSAISQGNAQAASMNHQAKIDERNRILADQDRQMAIRTANIAAEDQRREQRRRLADMRASMGATGLEVGGSPLDALADSSIEMALDSRRTDFEGYVRNREGQIEMLNYADSAAANRRGAKSARQGGYISAGASLLSGGAKTYKSFDENGYF